ncbi:lysylphosphatidylglycerol synthase transmembrane domain-containing protein [Bacillus sp. FJAT-27245]|uniref:lysylphosphatidylglycerol synthase transmembrane domain-containing protein n=1 Tax=Bacillus sp. FJAT-27245 TaxID=1684144 RepID=UPI0006A7DA77|nr:lysylphosphatidylglycerol synthase transmembrane domain-containing protein [Bacillus sp. FJAT-27245]
MKNRLGKKGLLYAGGLFFLPVFLYLSARHFSGEEIRAGLAGFFLENPLIIISVTIAYFLSFSFRAAAWRLYLGNRARFGSCLQAILLSLAVNHLFPVKIGDAFRIGLLTQKEKHIKADESAHSVIVLRLLDIFILLLLSAAGILILKKSFVVAIPEWAFSAGIIMAFLSAYVLYRFYPSFFTKHLSMVRQAFTPRRFIPIAMLTIASWLLEGAVVLGVAASIGNPLGPIQAVWVNSVTVGGQVFQITPGGIATYESIMAIALASFQFPADKAYVVALVSHGYKFVFSYAAGVALLFFTPFKTIWRLRKKGRTGGNAT